MTATRDFLDHAAMRAGLLACTFAIGCHGPLTKPMVDRLDDEQQAKVDQVWDSMFTPVDRCDATLLLDLILSAQLHQIGIDHLRLVSEKYVGDGLVVMEVAFDRENPQFDEFSVSYIDSQGEEIRRERFSRQDVEERIEFLFMPAEINDETPADQIKDLEWLAAEQEARQQEIQEFLAPLADDDQTSPDDQGE